MPFLWKRRMPLVHEKKGYKNASFMARQIMKSHIKSKEKNISNAAFVKLALHKRSTCTDILNKYKTGSSLVNPQILLQFPLSTKNLNYHSNN